MDAFFAGLSKRQAMLLLTAVTFGGQEGVESFDHLPDDEGELLRDRAAQILAIPREKRVPFLVQEIKRFITGHKLDILRFADPKRVAEALANERPALIEVILRALPASIADEARLNLAQPIVELKHEVRRDVLAIIRWKFEERLAPSTQDKAPFSLQDLLVMPSRDLIFLADILGARSFASLIAPLPESEREEILKKLAPEQRQVAARAADPRAAKRLPAEKARELIEKAFAENEPKQAVRLMGVRRVAKACLSHSSEFASRVIEQHRNDFGRQLAQFVSDERQKGLRPDPAARNDLLHELEDLAVRGAVERPVRLPPPPMAKKPTAAPRPAPKAVATPAPVPRPRPEDDTARIPPRTSRPGPPVAPAAPESSRPVIQLGGAAAPRPSPKVKHAAPAPAPAPSQGKEPPKRASQEHPIRRPSIVRPSPFRGPRKP